MKPSICISTTLILTLLISCCLYDNSTSIETSYQWVKLGNKLNYDLITDTATIPSYRQLEIIINPGNSNLRFRENNIYDNDNNTTYFLLMDLDYNVYPAEDGLYTSVCVNCGWDCFFGFNYLKAPKNPTLNQMLPEYFCKDEVETMYKTITVDTIISVPLGTYKTFVLQDTSSFKKEYWNPDKGLIRLDFFNRTSNKLTESFVLSKTNY